jgi:hypothetical protein
MSVPIADRLESPATHCSDTSQFANVFKPRESECGPKIREHEDAKFARKEISILTRPDSGVRLLVRSGNYEEDSNNLFRAAAKLTEPMSALPPKADIAAAQTNVRSKADSCTAAKALLFDHLIGSVQ